jgi:hypothetical protein
MTLRGEKVTSPAQRQFPRLFAWLHTAEAHLDTAMTRAEQSGLHQAKRRQVVVRVDGRDMDMETILTTLRFHLTEEYPYLLENLTEHSMTALYASNLNDRYWVMSLAQSEQLDDAVQDAVATLSAHLDNIPPSNEAGA